MRWRYLRKYFSKKCLEYRIKYNLWFCVFKCLMYNAFLNYLKIFKNKKGTAILRIWTASITGDYRDIILWIFQFLTKPSNCTKFHENMSGSFSFSSKSVGLKLDWPNIINNDNWRPKCELAYYLTWHNFLLKQLMRVNS